MLGNRDLRGPGKCQHAFNNLRDPVDILEHQLAELTRELGVVQLVGHQLRERADRRQGVANLVRHACRNGTEFDQLVFRDDRALHPAIPDSQRDFCGELAVRYRRMEDQIFRKIWSSIRRYLTASSPQKSRWLSGIAGWRARSSRNTS